MAARVFSEMKHTVEPRALILTPTQLQKMKQEQNNIKTTLAKPVQDLFRFLLSFDVINKLLVELQLDTGKCRWEKSVQSKFIPP